MDVQTEWKSRPSPSRVSVAIVEVLDVDSVEPVDSAPEHTIVLALGHRIDSRLSVVPKSLEGVEQQLFALRPADARKLARLLQKLAGACE